MVERRGFLCLLALQKIFFSTPRIAASLVSQAGCAEDIFDGDRSRYENIFEGHESLWNHFKTWNYWDDVEKILQGLDAKGIVLLSSTDERYPRLLRQIYDPPPVISVLGRNLELMSGPIVAIVGSRKASNHSKDVAFEMAEFLSDAGIAVVSGMAYGCDAWAHRGAIEGGGRTIAVLGTGIDVIYPAAHYELYHSIADSGVVISEFPPGTCAFPSNFPQRNRIISGMSLATVIVEAAEKSGSLITARLALEQGREVYAAPGPAASCFHHGANCLIKDGAPLVECGKDVLELIQKQMELHGFSKKPGHFDVNMDKHSALLGVFEGSNIYSIDEIVLKTGLDTPRVIAGLAELAIEGVIVEKPGQRFTRARVQCQIH